MAWPRKKYAGGYVREVEKQLKCYGTEPTFEREARTRPAYLKRRLAAASQIHSDKQSAEMRIRAKTIQPWFHFEINK